MSPYTNTLRVSPYPKISTHDSGYASSGDNLPLSSASSISSQSSDDSASSEEQNPFSLLGRSRPARPRLPDRARSTSSIIPKGTETRQKVKPEYPPTDARAMSPRRNAAEVQELEAGVRRSLQEHAQSLQSSLAALAQRVDEVRQDHDKLETENRFLQEYIGGLTRNMSKESNLGRSNSTRKGKK